MIMRNNAVLLDKILEEDYHVGQRIMTILKEKGRSIAWFSERMNSDRSNMYKILTRPHLNSEFILRASLILDHDFFKDISEWMKSTVNEK